MDRPRPVLLALLAALAAAAAAAAEPSAALVSRTVCDRLVPHQPAPDVTYRPGTDVRGRPVAPADLGRAPVELPAEIGMDILVPWPMAPPRPDAPPTLYRGEVYAGFVTLAPDGTLLFNGRSLTDPEQDYLAYLCREAMRPR
jgi:hypothetical protein